MLTYSLNIAKCNHHEASKIPLLDLAISTRSFFQAPYIMFLQYPAVYHNNIHPTVPSSFILIPRIVIPSTIKVKLIKKLYELLYSLHDHTVVCLSKSKAAFHFTICYYPPFHHLHSNCCSHIDLSDLANSPISSFSLKCQRTNIQTSWHHKVIVKKNLLYFKENLSCKEFLQKT